jgi:uncharacterized protein YbjT (DUF2867 family)
VSVVRAGVERSSSVILITGATGNVGAEVVRALVAAGEEVRALVRDPAEAVLPAGVEAAARRRLPVTAPMDTERPAAPQAASTGAAGSHHG